MTCQKPRSTPRLPGCMRSITGSAPIRPTARSAVSAAARRRTTKVLLMWRRCGRCTCPGCRRAVGDSGGYERARHTLGGRSGERADGLLGLTVAGPSPTLADAYATAGFAMGKSGIGWAAAHEGYAAYGITATGHAFYSDAFAALIVT